MRRLTLTAVIALALFAVALAAAVPVLDAHPATTSKRATARTTAAPVLRPMPRRRAPMRPRRIPLPHARGLSSHTCFVGSACSIKACTVYVSPTETGLRSRSLPAREPPCSAVAPSQAVPISGR